MANPVFAVVGIYCESIFLIPISKSSQTTCQNQFDSILLRAVAHLHSTVLMNLAGGLINCQLGDLVNYRYHQFYSTEGAVNCQSIAHHQNCKLPDKCRKIYH